MTHNGVRYFVLPGSKMLVRMLVRSCIAVILYVDA